ncbi:MAG: F0F1 ATP synthase subunit A [Candidatus Saganbacteria bacterium]|nr:F0F1 ATP synthase subunit A [Candidatus Saganbacteria bacterium]
MHPKERKNSQTSSTFLVALFSFILFCNLLGLIPGFSSPTSNINVTGALAVTVFLIVQVYGIIQKGPLKYLGHFVPEGTPLAMAPFLFVIELILQLAKPFSLAVRLFANVFAGHTTLFIVLGLIFMLKNYLLYSLPIIGYLLIATFEIFIGFIQAFIFTFLTASYLGEVAGENE